MLAFAASTVGTVLHRPLYNPHRSLSPVRPRRTSRHPPKATAPSASQAPPSSSPPAYEDDDGRRVVPVALFIAATAGQPVSGVYAVQTIEDEVIYISLSRDVRSSLQTLLDKHGDDFIFAVRVMTFALAMPDAMRRVADDWILDEDVVPEGNALGWNEPDSELAERAQWPAVWQPPPAGGVPLISPFAVGAGAAMVSTDGEVAIDEKQLDLTVDNVDMVLEEVRPYLMADGGNIAVVEVNADTGVVRLSLQGACGSCDSAAVTMREGVEKALRKRFGEQLKEVSAVSALDPGYSPIASVAACERALEPIRGVLRGLGADVEVIEVDEDEVVVSYSGPSNLRLGVETQLLERVPGLEVVTFE